MPAEELAENGAARVASCDVDELRAAGLSDQEIFEATVFCALRLAFSTVNNALGVRPDWQVAAAAPPDAGFDLWVVYVVWFVGLAILFPLCLWYGNYKFRKKHWLLS